ncbi:MAG TPA: hypothetical protein VF774_27790 [Pseudoduganella sp.]
MGQIFTQGMLEPAFVQEPSVSGSGELAGKTVEEWRIGCGAKSVHEITCFDVYRRRTAGAVMLVRLEHTAMFGCQWHPGFCLKTSVIAERPVADIVWCCPLSTARLPSESMKPCFCSSNINGEVLPDCSVKTGLLRRKIHAGKRPEDQARALKYASAAWLA